MAFCWETAAEDTRAKFSDVFSVLVTSSVATKLASATCSAPIGGVGAALGRRAKGAHVRGERAQGRHRFRLINESALTTDAYLNVYSARDVSRASRGHEQEARTCMQTRGAILANMGAANFDEQIRKPLLHLGTTILHLLITGSLSVFRHTNALP